MDNERFYLIITPHIGPRGGPAVYGVAFVMKRAPGYGAGLGCEGMEKKTPPCAEVKPLFCVKMTEHTLI